MSSNENIDNKLLQDLASRSQITVYVESTVLCLIFCLGITGNTLVFSAIWRNVRLRTISNMFVVALAVSDILMSSLCMPYSLVTLISGQWIFGERFCQVHGFCVFTLGMVSLHTMGLVSVNRFFCIVKRATYQRKFTTRRTFMYILIVWFIALVGSVPPLFFKFGGFAFQPGKAMCLYTFEANIPYTVFIEVVYIGTPLGIITFCYASVFKEVYRTNKVFALNQLNADQLQPHVRETKITKTLAVVFLGFTICWLPISVIDYLDAVNGKPMYQRQVYLMYSLLAYISSLLNPIIYGIASRSFRREYKKMLKDLLCWKHCVNSAPPVRTTLSTLER